jgi:UDP-glucose 4-epimerase
MKILVTGATGAIGPVVVNALCQAGYQIRTFSLDSPTADMFPPCVEVIEGDITEKAAVESAMQGEDAVVHMAALLHIVNPSFKLREKYESINVYGTSSVVKAAINAGVKRVVLFSTIAVYGHSDGQVLNEESQTNPDTFYAKTKLAAEEIVLSSRDFNGHNLGTVLRLGAIYGSRIKGNYERLIRALACNRFIPIGRGINRRTLIYDKDVGRAAILAVSHPAAAGRVFNVTDGSVYTLNEIIDSICFALGRKSPVLSLPVGPVRFAAGMIEHMARLAGIKSPIERDMIDKYIEDVAIDSQRIQRELGFMPEYDLVAGWQDAVQIMMLSGELKKKVRING